MAITKITAKFQMPGSTMYSPSACIENPVELTTKEQFTVTTTTKKGKKTFLNRETLHYNIRKTIPAIQILNIAEESYQYMISTDVPEFSTKGHWNRLSKKQRIEAHLSNIALALNATLIDYTIYPD